MLLRLVREYDVLLESFRPGVMDRLGVGYERLSEENPALVYCAITGYGQDGPYRDRSGHDMNYLGLVGLLGLTGESDGPPVQAAGQIADLGGGALMAAFGILAALRERDRSGKGQLVDVSMADGALSWLAMVAGPLPRRAAWCRERGDARAGGQPHLLPALRLQGRLGDARRARAEVLAGVVPRRRARGPDREAVRGARLRRARRGRADLPGAHARGVAGVRLRITTAASSRCSDLDEALDSELVRAREMVVELDQPGTDGVRQLGVPVKLSRTPGRPGRARARRSGEHTERGAVGARLRRGARSRRWRRPARWPARRGRRPRELHGVMRSRTGS